MKLNRTESPLSPKERRELNENWDTLENEFNNVIENMSEEAFDKVIDGSKIDWSQMVDTVSALPSNAEEGETRGVSADNKIYRYNGTNWVPIAEINLNPISEVDSRLNDKINTDIAQLDDKIDDGLNSVNQQLAQTDDKVSRDNQSIRKGYHEGAVVCFSSDDGHINDYTNFKPIFVAEGVPCNIAVVGTWVGQQNRMTLPQIKELKELGWSVASHGWAHLDPTIATAEEMDEEYSKMHEFLKENGLDYDIVVYPFGRTTESSLTNAREYYKMGINIVKDDLSNEIPKIDNLNLKRLAGLSQPINIGGEVREPSLQECINIIDDAIDNNELIIIEDHSGYPIWNQQKLIELQQLIQHIKNRGVPIVNFQDAFNMKANIIDIKSDKSHYKLFRNGIESKGGFEDYSYDNSTPITHFPYGETRTWFTSGQISGKGFPFTNSGTITTSKTENSTYSDDSISGYQTALATAAKTLYMRRWLTNGTWSDWSVVAQDFEFAPLHKVNPTLNAYSASDGVGLFSLNTITTFVFNNAGNAGMPCDAGIVTAYRILHNDWGKQECREYKGNRIWVRYAISSSNWSEWELITPSGRITFATDTRLNSDPITDFPKFTIEHVDVSSANSTIADFPEGKPGTLTTYRNNVDVYAYQTYHIRAGVSVYKRYWDNANTVWSVWTISAV